MKIIIRKLLAVCVVTSIILWGMPLTLKGQDPPPPPGNHGSTGNQMPGGSAPLGEGVALLSLLAAGYAGWKLRRAK